MCRDAPAPAQEHAIPGREVLVRRAVVEPMSARVAPAPHGHGDYRADGVPHRKVSLFVFTRSSRNKTSSDAASHAISVILRRNAT